MKYFVFNSWLDSFGFWGVLGVCDFNEKIPFVESLVPHVLSGDRVMNYAHFISTNKRKLESRGDKAALI